MAKCETCGRTVNSHVITCKVCLRVHMIRTHASSVESGVPVGKGCERVSCRKVYVEDVRALLAEIDRLRVKAGETTETKGTP